MLSIQLMNNSSPVEKIGKELTAGGTYQCSLKEDTSVLNPIIIIKTSDPVYSYNYMYISDFGRYYFIDDIKSVNNNIWEVHAHVDVLETYKTQILTNSAVVARQQNKFNTYLNDPEWKVYANENVVAYKFTSPFTKALNFLLATAGA